MSVPFPALTFLFGRRWGRNRLVPPKKAIQSLIERLPGHSEAIERAYAESEYFRSICGDFLVCSRALTYWNAADSRHALVHREEYRQLLEELKQEILVWLKTTEGCPDPPRDRPDEANQG